MPKQPATSGAQIWLAILGIAAVPFSFCCVCSGVTLLIDRPPNKDGDLVTTQKPRISTSAAKPTEIVEAPTGPPPEPAPLDERPVREPARSQPKEPAPTPPKDPFAAGEVLDVRPQEVPAFPTGSLALVRTPRSSFTPAYRNEESRKAGRSYGVLNGEGVRVITPGPKYTTVEILTGTYGGNTADVPTASLAEITPPKPRYSAGYTQAELDAMAANQLPIAIPAIGGTGGRGPVHVQGYYRNGRWVSSYYRGR